MSNSVKSIACEFAVFNPVGLDRICTEAFFLILLILGKVAFEPEALALSLECEDVSCNAV